MELNGKVITILPQVTGEGKNGQWKKQEFVIETGDQYPKKVIFELWGDKIDSNPVVEGQDITVYFDAESREYNGRWYTNLRAWRVSASGGAKPANTSLPAGESFTESGADLSDTTDDLPF